MLARPHICSPSSLGPIHMAGTVPLTVGKAISATLEPQGETEAKLASTSPGARGLEGRRVEWLRVPVNVPHLTSCKSPHSHHPTWTVLVTVRSLGDDKGGWAWRAGPSGVGHERRRTWSSMWTGPQKYGLTSRPCENQPGPLRNSWSSSRAASCPVPPEQSEGT